MATSSPVVGSASGWAVKPQPQAVHEAGAGEPVISRWIARSDRARAVAQVPSVQLPGDSTTDAELAGRGLVGDGREVAAIQVGVRVERRRWLRGATR